TACRSTIPVNVPVSAHGFALKNTVEDARLAPFCTIKKSRSKLVGPTDDVVTACQFPETLAFSPGRLVDESSPHPTRKPAPKKTAHILQTRTALPRGDINRPPKPRQAWRQFRSAAIQQISYFGGGESPTCGLEEAP